MGKNRRKVYGEEADAREPSEGIPCAEEAAEIAGVAVLRQAVQIAPECGNRPCTQHTAEVACLFAKASK